MPEILTVVVGLRERAAFNNAHWCDIVSRARGASTAFCDDAWTSRTRTPLFYPDAVTLRPDVSVPALLSRIDTARGCSIKDSFACLDLAAHGFQVLFDARWLVLRENVLRQVGPPAPPAGVEWQVVSDGHDLGFIDAGPLRVWTN